MNRSGSMKRYDKLLMAIHNEERNCYASKGSWLYIADKKDTKKGLFRLPHYIHYFVSLDSNRLPSELGVVKTAPKMNFEKLVPKTY